MADLLECLLQIKGLGGTVDRLGVLLDSETPSRWETTRRDGPSPAALLARLAEIEIVHAAALRLMLTSLRPVVPSAEESSLDSLERHRHWNAAEAFDRFAARRRDNLEILDRCSADDLSRTGIHPHRREMTVADLVAVMLATDVEHFGEIRRRLQEPSDTPA